MNKLYRKATTCSAAFRTLILFLLSIIVLKSQAQVPLPDILYYKFDGTGNKIPNYASNPPALADSATIIGPMTQGAAGKCGTALVGNGQTSAGNYVSTNWQPDIGGGSWTISFWTSNIESSTTLFYIFGSEATVFRCFTNGVAGPGNWILRGTGFNDVSLIGAASTQPTLSTFVYDSATNTVKGYINGQLANTVAQSANLNLSSQTEFKVAGYSSNVALPEGGLLDEFRFYRRALSPEEVAKLFSSSVESTIVASLCNGTYLSPSGKYTWNTPGIYLDTINSVNCTDSIITINLQNYDNNAFITSQPQSVTVQPNEPVSFGVSTLAAALYEWQIYSGGSYQAIPENIYYSGTQTDTLRISQANPAMNNFVYRCKITGPCGVSYTEDVQLSITADPELQIPAIPAITYGNHSVALVANSNSPAAMTVTSDNPTVADVYLHPVSQERYIRANAAGVTKIRISQNAEGVYAAATDSVTITIVPALLNIKADTLYKIYGDGDPTLGFSLSGLVNDDDSSVVTGGLSRVAGEEIGSYTINPVNLDAGANYTISFLNGVLYITPATLTVQADAKTKVYGDTDPELTYTVTGYKNGDNASVLTGSPGRVSGENVGGYAIGQNTLSAGDNYTIEFVSDSLVINPAALTVQADAKTKVYGDADPALTYTATGYRFADNNSIFTGSLARTAGEDAGSYAIGLNTLDAGINYNIVYTAANFTITKSQQTITWTQQLQTGCDGVTTVQLTAVSSSGLPVTYTSSNNSVATVSGNNLQAINAGSATITAAQAGNQNYFAATSVDKVLTNAQAGIVKQHFADALYSFNTEGKYVQWQWYKNGALIPGATSAYYTEPGLYGSYHAVITDRDGNSFATCPLLVNSNAFTGRKISITPNPVDAGSFARVVTQFTTTELQGATLVISDVVGNVVKQQRISATFTNVQMPFNKGIYVVTLLLSNGTKESTNVVVR